MIVLLKRRRSDFMIRTLIISLLVTVMTACNKDKNGEATILGKWWLENYTQKDYDNNVLINTVVEPGGGIAYEFFSNGELVITTPGEPAQTLSYFLSSANQISISGQQFEIKILSNSILSLYAREDYGVGRYKEALVNLER